MEIEENSLDKGLEPETWRKIFEYVPKADRKNLTLVNSFFYEIAVKIKKDQYLVINEENFDDSWIFSTKRKFAGTFIWIVISDESIEKLQRIFQKHGSAIKSLTIMFDTVSTVNAAELFKLLECMPNLDNIFWSTSFLNIYNWKTFESPLRNLQKLELAINEDTGPVFAQFFAPDTIKSLRFIKRWRNFDHLIKSQSAIIKLGLRSYFMENVHVYDQLKLDELSIQCDDKSNLTSDEIFVARMLAKHSELKEVKFRYYSDFGHHQTAPELVRAFNASENLEYLQLKLINLASNDFNLIRHIPKLKKIVFDITNMETNAELLKLSKMVLNNVEKVTLVDEKLKQKVGKIFLRRAGSNWTQLKHFKLNVSLKTKKGIDLLNDYLDNFPKLEILRLNCEETNYSDDSDESISELKLSFTFRSFDQTYPLMRGLEIYGAKVNHLADLIAAMPNMKYIRIERGDASNYSPRALFNLTQLKKLQHVSINFKEKSRSARFTDQEVNWIKMLGRQVKSFELSFVGSMLFQNSIRDPLLDVTWIKVIIKHDTETILTNLNEY